LTILIICVGCVWIWGCHKAELWLKTPANNTLRVVLLVAALGLIWWLVVLAKLWWEAFLKEAKYLLDVIEKG
jgi:hypothetical protein